MRDVDPVEEELIPEYGIIADLYDRSSKPEREPKERAPRRPGRRQKAEVQKKTPAYKGSKKGKKKANTSRFKTLGK